MNRTSDALLTDLYELTMAQAYFAWNMTGEAVFEFFVRRLPARRNFFMAAGLEQVLDFLETFQFADGDIDWLTRSGGFTPDSLTALRTMRFTGDVHAMPEGTVFFRQGRLEYVFLLLNPRSFQVGGYATNYHQNHTDS